MTTKRAMAEDAVRTAVAAAVDAGVNAGDLIPHEILSVAAICAAADASTSVGVHAIQAVAADDGTIETVPGVGVRLTELATGNVSSDREDVRADLEAALSLIRRALAALDAQLTSANAKG